MERGFVLTDERLRTNLPNVYAVGDIVPGLQLAHRGFQQGIFVAEEIAGLNRRVIDEAGIPRVTYCDPEVASRRADRGPGQGEVRRPGQDAHLRPRPATARARSSRRPGFVKLVSVGPTARWSASTWSAPGSAS